MGRDAAIIIEGEMRQFDQKRMSEKSGMPVQRYVESLVTGNFMKVQKEINLNAGLTEEDLVKDQKVISSNREFYEREMKLVQKLWVNRIHKLFYLYLGLLAGMSLMQLLFVMTPATSKL